jgi:hypothetical protein
MNGWLERFGASDAEEEEVVDLNPAFRALLGERASEPTGKDARPPVQARERKPRPPAR